MENDVKSVMTWGKPNGTRIPPTFDPELKMLLASARSRFGNHSVVVLTAAGKLPPSPNARRMRTRKKPPTVLTSEWLMAANPQNAQAIVKPQRNPSTSIMRPARMMLTAYAA